MRAILASAASWPAPVQGALLMTGAACAFSLMIILIREASETLHPFVVAFWRNAFGLVFMLPWLARVGLGGLKTRRLGLYTLRGMAGIVAMLTWFYALSVMPIAEAVSLSFTVPLFATIAAAVVLREVVRARRWTATAVGFVGVLVILRPGVEAISPAALLVLVSSLSIAVSVVMIKMLSQTENSNAIVVYMVLFLTPLSLVPALFVWGWPAPATWLLLIGIGLAGTLGHIGFTNAMRVADASAVLPLDYLRLPLVAVAGYALYGETMDLATWAGAAIIIAATLYIARREAIVARDDRRRQAAEISAPALRERP